MHDHTRSTGRAAASTRSAHCPVITTPVTRLMHRLKPKRRGSRNAVPATITWDLDCRADPTPNPIQSVRVFPHGPVYPLDAFRWGDMAKRWLSVGRAAERDIIVDDPTVSALHGFLARNQYTGRVYVLHADSYNGLLINGLELLEGNIEISCGSLLSLGGALLLACGDREGCQRPTISGDDLHNTLQHAIKIYGTQNKAAKAWKIEPSTLSRWLAKRQFAHED